MQLLAETSSRVVIKAACHQSSSRSTTKLVSKDSGRHLAMDKSAVTRTFSIGAICSGTSSSVDFSARRHSSSGIRALLWATSSAKAFGSSLGSHTQTSRENIFPNILTPDNIPQFTIPSLSVENGLRSLDKQTAEDGVDSGKGMGIFGTEQESSVTVSPACSSLSSTTSSTSGFSLVLSDRRAERSVSDPLTHRRSPLQREGSYTEADHCLDPASRAALSLPHLTKVTTSYGFITLGQSPQMVSEEALLCQAALRRINKDHEDPSCSLSKARMRAGDIKDNSSNLPGTKKRLSKDSTNSQTKGILVKADIKAASASSTNTTVSPLSAPTFPDTKPKRHLYDVIRRHFTTCR